MIGCDQHRAATAANGIQQAPDNHPVAMACLAASMTPVAHHVGVGVVDHDQAVNTLVNRCDAAVGQLIG